MKLALDASVLLTVFNQEPGATDRGYLRRYFPDLAVLRP